MIRHIVMFNAKDPKNREAIFTGLKILETIEGDWTLIIRRNMKIDQIGNDMDFVVYGEFQNEADLKAYKSHPNYQKSIDIVRPLRDQRVAVDVGF